MGSKFTDDQLQAAAERAIRISEKLRYFAIPNAQATATFYPNDQDIAAVVQEILRALLEEEISVHRMEDAKTLAADLFSHVPANPFAKSVDELKAAATGFSTLADDLQKDLQKALDFQPPLAAGDVIDTPCPKSDNGRHHKSVFSGVCLFCGDKAD